MGELIRLFLFLLFLLQYQGAYSSSSSSSSVHSLCPQEQSSALLQFMRSFTVSSSTFPPCNESGRLPYPKNESWNENYSNCCLWDGVTCDGLTGHVIALDLSCNQLYGTIQDNSTLFQLSHLRRLNLAYNDFGYSPISSSFGRFANLTHLNLSYTSFIGSIPSEIVQLSKLVSLDLSSIYYRGGRGGLVPTLEPNNFKRLIQNLTQLQELFLPGVQISSVVPDSLMNLSSLTSLDLSGTGLLGRLPHHIFLLPNLRRLFLRFNFGFEGNLPQVVVNRSRKSSLRELDLSETSLSGELPASIGYLSSSLMVLDLSQTSLSGRLPDSIGHLKSLISLRLENCGFSGNLPQSLGNLSHITELYLSSNHFSGQIPSTISNLQQLTHLDLTLNQLGGQIPDAFDNLRKLEYLLLPSNSFVGQFPSSVANITALVSLDFSNNALTGSIPTNIGRLLNLEKLYLYNNALTGCIPPNITGFQNLQQLLLSNNSLNGTIPAGLFTLPSLRMLDLSSNRFTDFSKNEWHDHDNSALEYVELSGNLLHGPIQQSIFSNLVSLSHLDLSSNNLSGIELHMFANLKDLGFLDLSQSSLSVSPGSFANITLPNLTSLLLSSCKIGDEFPDFVRNSKNLQVLDLSNNNIHGHLPKWVGNGEISFTFLDLSHNHLQGPLLIPLLSVSTYFMISHNELTGKIPSSICNLSSLEVLDLSHNNLSGEIPQCLGNFSYSLSVLNLGSNGFQGTLSLVFPEGNNLRNLDLNGNHFEGSVPWSLANCTQLEVLDLGNNNINSTFPYWLETLPKLQVLVLRSNRFHGPILTSKTKLPFPKLRIIDLSHNKFTGNLPARYFENFRAMKNVNEAKTYQKYMGPWYYRDSVTVTMKGMEIELVRILTIFTTLDLSSNKFRGEIPKVIGRLTSLLVLNLSHNSIIGHIPTSFGDLTTLESLDLSSNQLTGKIPTELTSLTFLAVLNLSSNHLVGYIPQGKQFNTFQNDSYVGNSGLCGLPLSKGCGDNETQPQPPPMIVQQENDLDFFASGFTWQAVLMGYGCGMLFGLFIGYLMFKIGRPKWLVRIVEREQHRKVRRSKQIVFRWGGRRNLHT